MTITLTWYTIVGTIVLLALVGWMIYEFFDSDSGFMPGMGCVVPFFIALLFITIWGGIFWW